MPSLTSSQKSLVVQFMTTTRASEKTAQRYLKNANWSLDAAADQYFATNASSNIGPARAESTLEKMFEELPGYEPNVDKNVIEVEGMMSYFKQMGVSGESAEFFVLLEIVQAPGIGQITRRGYVDGWKATSATHSVSGHKAYVHERIGQLTRDDAYFKKVYRYAFIAGKEAEKKALDLEFATVYWQMLFAESVHPWHTVSVDWLKTWLQFLEENWTRSVNKDMWNQTLEFATKTKTDENLGFWSEDSAWPTVIDDFVAYCRKRNIGVAGSTSDGKMEVD